jgi:hypothetical protein
MSKGSISKKEKSDALRRHKEEEEEEEEEGLKYGMGIRTGFIRLRIVSNSRLCEHGNEP